jgi:hypothetical protein
MADVRVRGDGTVLGMRIRRVDVQDATFAVATTGAQFVYQGGKLEIYQGLGKQPRLLAQVQMEGEPRFHVRQETQDHVLLHSELLNCGVYGDSTAVLAPQRRASLKLHVRFSPAYTGRSSGDLLLIDEAGGLGVYAQPKPITFDALDSSGRAGYRLEPPQRMMIAAFPGRLFDWEASFRRHVVSLRGVTDANAYGRMPARDEIRALARYFDVVFVNFYGLYARGRLRGQPHPGGPYKIANPSEFRRFVNECHDAGLRVVPYTSPGHYLLRGGDQDGLLSEVRSLKREFGIDGVYIDGLYFGRINDPIGSWETIRRLRALFGAQGIIIYHGTSKGSPVGAKPNIDTYCDVTFYGEGVPMRTDQDEYVRYQVRKAGISNTPAAVWYDDNKTQLSWPERLAAILRLNCRMRWGSGTIQEHGQYRWRTKPDWWYLEYRKQLRRLERDYRLGRFEDREEGP